MSIITTYSIYLLLRNNSLQTLNNMKEETKRCPYCFEEINKDAIKCKHCGEFLSIEKNTATKETTKNKLPQNTVSQEVLSTPQKITVAVLCFLNPVIAGTIFYYGWRRHLPLKAKQANTISLWAFFTLLIVGMAVFVISTSTA